MSDSIEAGIQRVLEEVGVTGFVHARAIDHDREVALRADAPVVMASVFKIAVCLELSRQAAAGQVDLAERHLVAAATRSPGPVGRPQASLDDVEKVLTDNIDAACVCFG